MTRSQTAAWERVAFRKLQSLIPTGLVMKLPSRRYFKYDATADFEQDWFKDLVGDWRVLAKDELPECVLARLPEPRMSDEQLY